MIDNFQIKNLRYRKRLTQEQLAQKLGIGAIYLSQIETGLVTTVSLHLLQKLAKELGCKISDLIVEEGEN